MTRVAYDRLRERIIRGDYLPGQHLPAAEIAADLQMSRTPVREALFALEGEHLVVGSLNRGWTVRPLSREMISKLYDLRADLESFAARKAAENITDVPTEHTAKLWNAIAQLDELLLSKRAEQPGPIGEMMQVNTLIHETIVEASAYPHLSELISQTIDRGVTCTRVRSVLARTTATRQSVPSDDRRTDRFGRRRPRRVPHGRACLPKSAMSCSIASTPPTVTWARSSLGAPRTDAAIVS